jgi:hypothetical protein
MLFMSSSFGFFWMALALVFFVMAYQTYRVRQVLLPKAIEQARGKITKVMGVPAPDLTKLKPIFDDTLAVEVIAFILTGIAAIVDFLGG